MSITVTINSATLTPGDAGAVVAFLMAVQPDAVQAALERLDDGQQPLPFPSRADAEALERGTPEQAPVQSTRYAQRTEDWPQVAQAPVGTHPVQATQTGPNTLAPPRPWPEGEKVVEPITVTASGTITPAEAFGGAAPLDPAAAFGATPAAPAPAGTPDAPSQPSSNGPTATTAASPSDAPELDKLGLPWDDRIHATSREGTGIMTDKGVWRKKRGLNQLIEHKVVAELRETYPLPDAETPAQRTLREAVEGGLVAAPEAGSTAPAVAPPPPPPPPAAAAPPPPAASPAPPPPVPAGDDALSFGEAMQIATAAQTAGKITTAQTLAIVTEQLGLGAMRELAATANAHLVPRFVAALRELGA